MQAVSDPKDPCHEWRVVVQRGHVAHGAFSVVQHRSQRNRTAELVKAKNAFKLAAMQKQLLSVVSSKF